MSYPFRTPTSCLFSLLPPIPHLHTIFSWALIPLSSTTMFLKGKFQTSTSSSFFLFYLFLIITFRLFSLIFLLNWIQIQAKCAGKNKFPIFGFFRPTKIPNLEEWDKSQPGNLVGKSLVGTCLTLPSLGFLRVFFKYPKMSKNGNLLFLPVVLATKC